MRITTMLMSAMCALPLIAASQDGRPWMDARRSPDERAELALKAMTLDEQLGLLHGPMALSLPIPGTAAAPLPNGAVPGAGFIPGVPRLGIPSLRETDASLGVTNPFGARPGDVATALPAGLVLSATFDPELAYSAGALVGGEARAKGFNVLLGGGMNLTRDPRNGRNFEYLGEDPLLSGTLAGEEVRGTQSQHVISTVKHFALNAAETNRHTLDARIDAAALRESDLLAFNIAIERGQPGSVMCSYNKINGAYACANDWLLNGVLKRDWHYPGWVMSDWGAVHSTDDALAGLDQESGEQIDKSVWFGAALKAAVANHVVTEARVHDMAHRILRSMFAVGVDATASTAAIDYRSHGELALQVARQGMVLLKNADHVLPLSSGAQRIAMIGGFANVGVLSGGGSAQVTPSNGVPTRIPLGGSGEMAAFRSEIFDPSSPVSALQSALPQAKISFDSGAFPASAAILAQHSDVAIVFVTRHELEGYDVPNMSLPNGQDELVAAVAAANPRTVVVLETGNPVSMPWVDRVAAVVAAWYPGQEGGQAIADILDGAVNPSGRLPITFPRREADLVRPVLPNLGSTDGDPVSIDYVEGADAGYRWFALHDVQPLFAFGHGLSYTQFEYAQFQVSGGKTLRVRFDVCNSGERAGADVPQVYLTSAAGHRAFRLLGFQRVQLAPGERRTVSMDVDPRLLGTFDESQRNWSIAAGDYRVSLSRSAQEPVVEATARLQSSYFASPGAQALH